MAGNVTLSLSKGDMRSYPFKMIGSPFFDNRSGEKGMGEWCGVLFSLLFFFLLFLFLFVFFPCGCDLERRHQDRVIWIPMTFLEKFFLDNWRGVF